MSDADMAMLKGELELIKDAVTGISGQLELVLVQQGVDSARIDAMEPTVGQVRGVIDKLDELIDMLLSRRFWATIVSTTVIGFQVVDQLLNVIEAIR